MSNEVGPQATPEEHRNAVIEFYRLLGQDGPPGWSGQTMAIHFGLDTDPPSSLEESLVETNRELARRARIAPGMRVLDAGCGIGGSSIWLAKEFGAQVTGISLVPEQIAQAQAFARQLDVPGVSFSVGDFMATGFAPKSFDVVWNLESLCHCHDPAAYFRHAMQLLVDGGRIACLDVFLGTDDADQLQAMRSGGAFGRMHPPNDIAKMLERAGFVDVEIVDLRDRALRSIAHLRDLAHQFLLRERFREALFGMDTKHNQQHAIASVACTDAVLSGALTYAYIGARTPQTRP